MVVTIDGEGHVELVAGQQLGFCDAFSYPSAHGFVGHQAAPVSCFNVLILGLRPIVHSQLQLRVFLFHKAGRLEQRHSASSEDRLWIAAAKRFKPAQIIEQCGRDLVQRHLSVDIEDGLEIRRREARAGITIEMSAQFRHSGGLQGKAHGMRVSAVTAKQVAARLEGAEQVESRYRPAGTMGLVTVDRDYERRPAVSFYDSRGSNANHTAMPTVAIDHHAVGIPQTGILLEARLDLLHDAPLFLLTVAVELVEPGSKFASA